jgi:hypothetical protein
VIRETAGRVGAEYDGLAIRVNVLAGSLKAAASIAGRRSNHSRCE